MRNTNEPFFWALFGAGGMVSALVTPGLILLFAVAWGFDFLPQGSLAYERVSGVAHYWFSGLLISAVIGLTLWQCCHRIFHSLHDFGIHANLLVKVLVYGVAVAGTLYSLLLTVGGK